ncbi:methyl-accepting chemotaxis protein [Rheinheimera texasensis]|uniref:methyl-accepting chemotaxis protein n=1 Tax=Rheinheimera texasensis TaxID=306205 RepID=UPI0032B2A05F
MQYHFRAEAFQIANYVNTGLFVLSLVFSFIFASWLPTLLIGIPAVLMPWFLLQSLGDQPLTRISYGISYMLFAALQIHLSQGMLEMHFGIFVLLAILICLRDYLVVLVAAGFIAVHHLLFMWLQAGGSAVFVLPPNELRFEIVLVHAAYVVAETVVLVIICRNSLKEAQQAEFFLQTTEQMLDDDGRIWLHNSTPEVETRLTRNFAKVMMTLQGTVKTIDSAVSSLTKETEVLVYEGNTLSNRISNKLQEVERIATATEQMSMSIQELGESAREVLVLAQDSSGAANDGKSVVDKTINNINSLSGTLEQTKVKVNSMASSTSEIKGVLDVIQSIAEQTNLLALNAAIEAARAGEQGRGFAVVADEVRNLASKTHKSTDEIKQMIARLVQSSNESVSAVEQSLQELQATVNTAGESHQVLSGIQQRVEQVLGSADLMSRTLEQQGLASAEIARSTAELITLASEQQVQGAKVTDIAHHVEAITGELSEKAERFVVKH